MQAFDILPNCALDVSFSILDMIPSFSKIVANRSVSKTWKRLIDRWLSSRGRMVKVQLLRLSEPSLSLFMAVKPKKSIVSVCHGSCDEPEIDLNAFSCVEELTLEKPSLWAGNCRIADVLMTSLTNLKSLDVSNMRCYSNVPYECRFSIPPGITNLTNLTKLWGVGQESLPLSFTQLVSLNLSSCIDLEFLKKFINLRELKIPKFADPTGVMAQLTNITSLYLKGENWYRNYNQFMEFHPNLKRFSIETTKRCMLDFSNAKDSKDLVELSVSARYCQLFNVQLSSLTKLTSLHLCCQQMTRDQFSDDLRHLTKLEFLHLEVSRWLEEDKRFMLQFAFEHLPLIKEAHVD